MLRNVTGLDETLYAVERQGRDFFYLLSKWSFFIPQLNLWMLLWSGQITFTPDKSTCPPTGNASSNPIVTSIVTSRIEHTIILLKASIFSFSSSKRGSCSRHGREEFGF
jgi:hypothetical protein